jgi:hypothetical protein
MMSRCTQSPVQGSPQERGQADLAAQVIRDERHYLQILYRLMHARIPEQDLDEILGDLSEHFRMGRAAGRAEDDLIRTLGSPGEIAREIMLMHQVHPAMNLQILSTGHR